MKIYYGVPDINIDITDYVVSNLVKDYIILIPSNDHNRSKLFTDPLIGVHKMIIINTGNSMLAYDEFVDIYIDITNNKIYSNNNEIPEYIQQIYPNMHSKLQKIHSKLKIEFGSFGEEYPEQVMAATYLSGTEKVLEIGGNIGRNSLIIASLLNSSKQLLALECDENIAKQLTHNRDINNMSFFIESSALSKRKLIQKGWDTMVSDVLLDGYKSVNTITFDELTSKYNIIFDTLVLDCEGAFYYILQDMPEILTNIKLIIMENDYHILEQKQYVDSILFKSGFNACYTQAGGWGPCYNNFFEVWKRI